MAAKSSKYISAAHVICRADSEADSSESGSASVAFDSESQALSFPFAEATSTSASESPSQPLFTPDLEFPFLFTPSESTMDDTWTAGCPIEPIPAEFFNFMLDGNSPSQAVDYSIDMMEYQYPLDGVCDTQADIDIDFNNNFGLWDRMY